MHDSHKKVTWLKCRLIDIACDHVDCDEIAEINTHELGEVVDMIKDLAEVEEKCWKMREDDEQRSEHVEEHGMSDHHEMDDHTYEMPRVDGMVHAENVRYAPQYADPAKAAE